MRDKQTQTRRTAYGALLDRSWLKNKHNPRGLLTIEFVDDVLFEHLPVFAVELLLEPVEKVVERVLAILPELFDLVALLLDGPLEILDGAAELVDLVLGAINLDAYAVKIDRYRRGSPRRTPSRAQ